MTAAEIIAAGLPVWIVALHPGCASMRGPGLWRTARTIRPGQARPRHAETWFRM